MHHSKQAFSILCSLIRNSGSGKFKGRRHIYGDRKNIRNKLYMCVLSAIRKGSFKDLYDRLTVKGKPFKVKAASVMRKIILLANTLISKGEFYRDNMQQSA